MRVSRDQNLINFCFKMSICANSLWNSCNSGINIEAHSLGSQQLAGHFPMRLPIEADLDLFKTKGLEELCPRYVEHSHKSHLRHPVSELVSSICRNIPRYSYIFRLSSQTRSDQSSIIYYVSYVTYHSSSNTYLVSLIFSPPPCIASRLSPSTHHLLPSIYHLPDHVSFTTPRPSCIMVCIAGCDVISTPVSLLSMKYS